MLKPEQHEHLREFARTCPDLLKFSVHARLLCKAPSKRPANAQAFLNFFRPLARVKAEEADVVFQRPRSGLYKYQLSDKALKKLREECHGLLEGDTQEETPQVDRSEDEKSLLRIERQTSRRAESMVLMGKSA
jgi:hypothetical protein